MLRHAFSTILSLRNFTIASVHLMALCLILLPLTGCSDNGSAGGPSISSLSTPTDTHPNEGAEADPDSTETTGNEQDDPTDALTAAETEPLPSEDPDADAEALMAGLEGEEQPMVTEPSAPTGATARLTWAVHPDPKTAGYRVYYGKQSSGEPGSCSYETSQSVEAPPATITGLEPNTPYFFAISAFQGEDSEEESPCSNEVLVISSPAQG